MVRIGLPFGMSKQRRDFLVCMCLAYRKSPDEIGSTKSQPPAFADLLVEQVLWQARAAARREANNQIMAKISMTEVPRKTLNLLVIGVGGLDIIWNLGFAD